MGSPLTMQATCCAITGDDIPPANARLHPAKSIASHLKNAVLSIIVVTLPDLGGIDCCLSAHAQPGERTSSPTPRNQLLPGLLPHFSHIQSSQSRRLPTAIRAFPPQRYRTRECHQQALPHEATGPASYW